MVDICDMLGRINYINHSKKRKSYEKFVSS